MGLEMYRHVSKAWLRLWRERAGMRERAIAWRRGPTIVRLERPSRIDKARRLGYKAKQGFVVARVRVGVGGMRRKRPRAGRRPKHLGVVKMKANVSLEEVARRRVATKFPNLKVLNSYFVYRDGKHAWYECLLLDPNHPSIKNDQELRHRVKLASQKDRRPAL